MGGAGSVVGFTGKGGGVVIFHVVLVKERGGDYGKKWWFGRISRSLMMWWLKTGWWTTGNLGGSVGFHVVFDEDGDLSYGKKW